jgi:DNA-3-methyladenine glycosylase
LSNGLPAAFFQRHALVVARELLGSTLVSTLGGHMVRLRVVETEAYHECERGAHAFGGRRTKRNEAMFEDGGIAYVYFVYGMHWALNAVTGLAGTGEAVLIRAGVPDQADESMLAMLRERRGFGDGKGMRPVPRDVRRWLDGPAKLTQGLAVTGAQNARPFVAETGLWFEQGTPVADADVVTGPRIGIAYAGDDALLPWRFRTMT